jgi:hypothetical protein
MYYGVCCVLKDHAAFQPSKPKETAPSPKTIDYDNEEDKQELPHLRNKLPEFASGVNDTEPVGQSGF